MTITHVSRRQLAERNVVGKVVVSFVFVSSYYCLCRDVCRALTISRPPFFLQRDNPLEGKESASGVELSRDMWQDCSLIEKTNSKKVKKKKCRWRKKKRNSRFLWLFFFPVAVHLPLSSTPSTTQIVKKDPRAEWLLSLLPFLFPDVRTIQFFFERNTEDFNRASFQYNPTILLIISSSTRVLYRNISALLLLHFNCSGEILWKISTRDFIRFLGCRQIF